MGKRELFFLLSLTCNYVVSVRRVFSASCSLDRAALLAHLSRRLIGELIVYQWSGVRRRRPSIFSNIFFFKTALPIKAESPRVGGTNVCSRHLGHITKMAATPICGKNPSKIFSRTGGPISTKLGM